MNPFIQISEEDTKAIVDYLVSSKQKKVCIIFIFLKKGMFLYINSYHFLDIQIWRIIKKKEDIKNN